MKCLFNLKNVYTNSIFERIAFLREVVDAVEVEVRDVQPVDAELVVTFNLK